MPAESLWEGYDALRASMARLAHPDPTPLLRQLEEVIFRDNERGVLAGLDRNGQRMPVTKRQLDPNLSAKLGDGPPLAPKRTDSRVIKDLVTGFFQDGGDWVVFGAWENVLSKSGVPFLPFHFRGEGRLPVRDLAGLRPEGFTEAADLVDRFAGGLANFELQ
jgi:hypothetical protein